MINRETGPTCRIQKSLEIDLKLRGKQITVTWNKSHAKRKLDQHTIGEGQSSIPKSIHQIINWDWIALVLHELTRVSQEQKSMRDGNLVTLVLPTLLKVEGSETAVNGDMMQCYFQWMPMPPQTWTNLEEMGKQSSSFETLLR